MAISGRYLGLEGAQNAGADPISGTEASPFSPWRVTVVLNDLLNGGVSGGRKGERQSANSGQ
jgi:hypothetical protein